MSGQLFIVATPIGNLADLTQRATEVLRSVTKIAAEDTRHTHGLLQHLGIQKPLVALHGHSNSSEILKIVSQISSGEDWAYVSDAGTPGISDPGSDLVRAAVEAGIRVVPIPGACALTALLSVTGFLDTSFQFIGFFPRENKDRKNLLKKMKAEGGVWVGYESPHRVQELLETFAGEISEESLVIGRELTKKFEEILRGKCAELAAGQKEIEPRGEYVWAVNISTQNQPSSLLKSKAEIVNFLEELSGLGANQKLLVAAGRFAGLERSEAYDLALKIKQKS
jgi:16S rRNA (cytidine1402-2'-O)-methyltransferase